MRTHFPLATILIGALQFLAHVVSIRAEPLVLEPCDSLAAGSYSEVQATANGLWTLENAGLAEPSANTVRVLYFPGKTDAGERIATLDLSGSSPTREIELLAAGTRLIRWTTGSTVLPRRERWSGRDLIRRQIQVSGATVPALIEPIEHAMDRLHYPEDSVFYSHATALVFVRLLERGRSKCGQYHVVANALPPVIAAWVEVFRLLDLDQKDVKQALDRLESTLRSPDGEPRR
jgi:hypothetical protein